MIKLIKDLFKDRLSECAAIGLSYDKKFNYEFRKQNVKSIITEIDPSFPHAKKSIDWQIDNDDLALLLDTIENLVEPTYC